MRNKSNGVKKGVESLTSQRETGSKQRGKRGPEENCPLRREFWI